MHPLDKCFTEIAAGHPSHFEPAGEKSVHNGCPGEPTMLVKAVAVRVLKPYVIEVSFRDGTRREVGLESELWGEVFEPLRDPALVHQVAVDPTFGSVFWLTGADLAPEFLYFGEQGPPPDHLGDEAAAHQDIPTLTRLR